jgi:uncharacterized membrane protein HdeD (DUF308 family)
MLSITVAWISRCKHVQTLPRAELVYPGENFVSQMNQIRDAGLSIGAEHTLEAHWQLFLAEGTGLIALGIGALILPPLASIGIAILLGWLLLLGGVFGLVTTAIGRHAPGFWWSLLSSIIAIVAGVLLFGWPALGALSLTLILTIFLATDGFVTIMIALEYRRAMHGRWGWLMVNGALDLILAAIIVLALPASALWAVGIIIGIDLLFGGSSLVALSLAARSNAKTVNRSAAS